MGHRANYIIVEEGKQSFYYHHWGSNQIPKDMFWGPLVVEHFIKSLEPVEQLMDDVWCEGAVVFDKDKQLLLMFGGESILWSNTLKRVYLALTKILWRDWTVKWAKNDFSSILYYINHPFENHISNNDDLSTNFDSKNFMDLMQYDGSTIAIKTENISFYETDWYVSNFFILWYKCFERSFTNLTKQN